MLDSLVTGSSGFIGGHLVEKLRKSGQNVLPIDKLTSAKHDLMNIENVMELPDTKLIYHLAAFNGTKHFYERPTEVLRNNTLPTIHLADRYSPSNTRFIFASTCEIFNGAIELNSNLIPTKEDVPVTFIDIENPRWSYSLPKALGENLISNAFHSWSIVRFFNIFGPNQQDHFISEFVERAKKGIFEIYGNDTRSFCFVSDAVEMLSNIGESNKNSIFHVGNSHEVSVEHVARVIMELMGFSHLELKIFPSPRGSVSRRCPDVTNYENTFGKVKYTKLEDGLEQTLKSLI